MLYLKHMAKLLKTLDLAFAFLRRLQNLNGLFSWVFESLGRLFWNKYSAEFFGNREKAYKNTCLHTSNENRQILIELHIFIFYFEILKYFIQPDSFLFFSISVLFFCFFVGFFFIFWEINY